MSPANNRSHSKELASKQSFLTFPLKVGQLFRANTFDYKRHSSSKRFCTLASFEPANLRGAIDGWIAFELRKHPVERFSCISDDEIVLITQLPPSLCRQKFKAYVCLQNGEKSTVYTCVNGLLNGISSTKELIETKGI